VAETFFRIARTDPATELDFLSDKARGLPPRNNEPLTLYVWDGISVYRTFAQASRKARDYPFLGSYIAELHISSDIDIRVEKTFGRGHYTLWGAPDLVLACVVRISATP
jgi:hypothetical protein